MADNELELISTALQSFDQVAAGLALLEKNYKGVVYDVESTLGMEHARAARSAVREPRYEVERVRKSAKAPLLALGKRLDTEATRITNALLTLEVPIDEQIKSEETRKEREKQERIAAEERRVQGLQERIQVIRDSVTRVASASSAVIALSIQTVQAIAVDDAFAEFQTQAADAKTATIARLQELHASALTREAERERIIAERAELAKLRKEAEEREATERTRAAEERAALAKEEATRRVAREAEEARLRQEREAFEREQAEARSRQEAAEAQRREEARIAAIKKPSDTEIIRVLAEHYRVPLVKVRQWLSQMKAKEAA